MFDLTGAFDWAKERVDGDALMVIAVSVLFGVTLLRTALGRVQKYRPAVLAGFTDWWLVGGLIGVGLGLAYVETTAAGAVTGLLIAVFVTGGYEYLTRGGPAIAGVGKNATAGTVAPLVAICVGLACLAAGCGGPYLDPADPLSVEEACKDVEAVMESVTLLVLREEEADAAGAAELADVLAKVETALLTQDPEAIDAALAAVIDRLAGNDRQFRIYVRIVGRIEQRARFRLSGLDISAEDEAFLRVARQLTAAGVRGARLACETWPAYLGGEREDPN